MSKKSRTIEIDEDLQFQQKEWFWQRVGVGVLFAFVLAALLGFTGMGGPMSYGEAGDRSGPLFVEYDRVVRRHAPTTITLHLRSMPGAIRFFVSTPFLERIRVQSVVPEPELVSVETNRLVYLIRAGSPEVSVTIELEHETIGTKSAEVGLVGGPSVQFTQVAIF